MPNTASASTKLTMTACSVTQSGKVEPTGASFTVMINPSGYRRERKINLSATKTLGTLGPKNAFSSLDPEVITFEDIIIDGTGAVPLAAGGTASDVKTQIDALTAVIYTYVGDKHEPPWVKLAWGNFVFYCRLSTMSVNYTLFKPNGDPLRAKVKLAFSSAMTAQEEAKRAKRSSPDLSHLVTVVAGDTLPLLCDRIYRDSSYYPEIARINKLADFRRLKPGTQLLFPPLG